MDKTLTDAAVKAIDALIESELHTTSPGRYGRIIKLSRQAHDLVQLSVTRVKNLACSPRDNVHIMDQNGMDVDEYEEVAEDAARMAVGRMGVAVGGGGGGADNVDLIRELVAGMQTAFRPREPLPPSPLDQLHGLLDLRERLVTANKSVEGVDRQINEILANTTKEGFDVGLLPVVSHPVVLRGHPARADAGGLSDGHEDTLGAGEGGTGDLVEVGGEEEVAARG